MSLNSFVKLCALIGVSALIIQCSGHSSSKSAVSNAPSNSQNACQSFAAPCTISHGAGTQSCTDSSSGPVYGTCENIVCDPGFNLNPDGICVGGENVKIFSMLATGPSLAPAGVSSFIAELGATYDFVISGSQNVVSAGLNSAASYAKYISGQCSGNGYTFQPLTTNFQLAGTTLQFGDNHVTYTPTIADVIGGCVWQLCAVSNDTTVPPACVDMIAAVDPMPGTTTTTIAAPTTTLPPVTTTLPHPTTTTTTSTTMPPTTMPPTTTLPHPTTTTTTTSTTLPHPPTTTTSTTTTTLPHDMPKISGNVCVGAGSGQYNCMSLAQSSGTGANNLKKDIGCTTNVTINYRGQSISTSLFGNAAPYDSNGQGIHVTGKTVPFQGVNFMVYVNDTYSLTAGKGWISCSVLVSWPNFPNPPP